MARCDEMLAAGFAQLLYQFGDSVSYTPVGGSPVTVEIIVVPERVVDKNDQTGINRQHGRMCSVPLTAEAANGGPVVPSVSIHDTFEFSGATLQIREIVSKSQYLAVVEADCLATHEKTRDGFRRRN